MRSSKPIVPPFTLFVTAVTVAVSAPLSQIDQSLFESKKKAADAKNDLQAMKDKLQEKQNLNWEDKKNLTQNIEKQKELQRGQSLQKRQQ